MASSSSSSFSSSSSSSRPSYSSSLPVMALRDKIIQKIQTNRVTLIVGDTGCGKSSQVPQFLLEENMEPILCTQPRRFAVVAIARMVAEARKCAVGDEIGYHIGHLKSTSIRSKIVFKTAGVLLEEMLDKGLAALRYNVIILDEVHERSVESDLVLACVKQFMLRNKDLRVVLMSATADLARYRDYFKDLGRDERVEVLAIPSSGQKTNFQRKVFYLEQVTELLGKNSESLSDMYCSGTSPDSADADIKPEVHTLIHDLVLHIHENEPDIEKSILIFLPTYHSLEQQWFLLSPLNLLFKIHILHRSIDTEQALKAMQVWKSHRKVILATNIAESSVTIPGVAFVIDSCRSLQVFWDYNRKNDSTELTWVSKSQAEQRKGRTGRTCDGQIYRLVTGSFFSKFNDHEFPAILRLSLRQQVLMICCAEPKSINDPKVLLQKVLDPPDPDVVEDALSLLVHVHALEKPASHRGRYEPTFYGRLLASLPLSFDASVLILKFGEIGLLREGILIGVLMDAQPLPILHPFGQHILFTKFIDSYFEGNCDGKVLTGKKEMIYMGNLCAYQFWQRVFKDKHRLERLKQVVKVDEPKATQTLISKLEEEWCYFHNLVQTSLNHISEIYEDILNAVHRFRPKFFVTTNALPLYYDPYEFKHTCLLQSRLTEDTDALFVGHDHLDPAIGTRSCVALPFVASKDFQTNVLAGKLSTVIKEIRFQYTEDTSESQTVNSIVSQVISGASLCKFFMKGLCNKDSQCFFSHSYEAKRPVCKFFFTLQGCRNGDSCVFSHDYGPSISPFDGPHFCLPEDEAAEPASLLRLLPATAEEGYILLLDDTDLHFSINLSCHCDPSKMIASTSQPYSSISDVLPSSVKILWGASRPYEPIIGMEQKVSITWKKVQCVLWFAEFAVNSDDLDGQSRLLKNFFEFLAVRLLAETLYDVRVMLTMNNIRFSQLQVEKLGRECFFFLIESFRFDEASFGKFADQTTTKRPMTASRPITYVFYLHPPTDIQFGDYSAAFHKGLYKLSHP